MPLLSQAVPEQEEQCRWGQLEDDGGGDRLGEWLLKVESKGAAPPREGPLKSDRAVTRAVSSQTGTKKCQVIA